jgi:hypothetical protein
MGCDGCKSRDPPGAPPTPRTGAPRQTRERGPHTSLRGRRQCRQSRWSTFRKRRRDIRTAAGGWRALGEFALKSAQSGPSKQTWCHLDTIERAGMNNVRPAALFQGMLLDQSGGPGLNRAGVLPADVVPPERCERQCPDGVIRGTAPRRGSPIPASPPRSQMPARLAARPLRFEPALQDSPARIAGSERRSRSRISECVFADPGGSRAVQLVSSDDGGRA